MSFGEIFFMVLNLYTGAMCLLVVAPSKKSIFWTIIWMLAGAFLVSNGLDIAGV